VKHIYLDACILIYLIEKHPDHYPKIKATLDSLTEYQLAVSPLLRMEVLVKPLQAGNTLLQRRYEDFLAQQIWLAVPETVYEQALQLRATHRLKTPDALHLAIARYHGCTDFWTNDDRLNTTAGDLAVNVLADAGG
jgi:predicted nucleic acid-binding protein